MKTVSTVNHITQRTKASGQGDALMYVLHMLKKVYPRHKKVTEGEGARDWS